MLTLLAACTGSTLYFDALETSAPAPAPSTPPAGSTPGETGGDPEDTSAPKPPPSSFAGTFHAPYALPLSFAPLTVEVVDVDDDGRDDVVLVGRDGGKKDVGPGRVVLLRQDAHGALGAEQTLAVGHDLHADGSIAFGDLDGDGDTDLLVAHNDGITWFARDGGTWTAHEVPSDEPHMGCAVADLDLDGDADAVCSGQNADLLWANDGAGSLTLGLSNPFPPDVQNTWQNDVLVWQHDDDPTPDHVAMRGPPSALNLGCWHDAFLDTANGAWVLEFQGGQESPGGDIALSDFEGDGTDAFLMFCAAGAFPTTLYAATWDPASWTSFDFATGLPADTGGAFEVRDMDGDGVDEWVVADPDLTSVHVLSHAGLTVTGDVAFGVAAGASSWVEADDLALGDIDGDACADIVALGDGPTLYVLSCAS